MTNDLDNGTTHHPTVHFGWRPRWWHPGIVLIAAAGFFLLRISRDVPLNEHECLIAQAVRETSRVGDWTTPHYCGEPSAYRAPLMLWTVGALWRATGRLDALTLRLPSAMAGLGCLAVTWLLARTLFDARIALAAAVALASMIGVLFHTHIGTPDMLLTFGCLLSVWAFERSMRAGGRRSLAAWLCASYAFLAAALLARIPLPLVIVVPALTAYLFVTRRAHAILWRLCLPGLVLCGALFVVWTLRLKDHDLLGVDSLAVACSRGLLSPPADGAATDGPHRWYSPGSSLALFALPWTPLLAVGLIAPFIRRFETQRRSLWLPWCLVATNLVIFTAARSRDPEHFVPALPCAAILVGAIADRVFFCAWERRRLDRRWLLGLAVLLIIAMGIAAYKVAAVSASRWSMVPTLCLGGAGLVLAMWCADTGRWRASFVVAALSGAVGFSFWRATVARQGVPDYAAFARGLEQVIDLPSLDELRWVSRPDPRLVFHTDQIYRQVRTDLQVARELRRQGRSLTPDAFRTTVDRTVLDALKRAEPYFAVATEERLTDLTGERAPDHLLYVIYRYSSPDGRQEHDLVVFTNSAGTLRVRREGRREIRFGSKVTTRHTTVPALPLSTGPAP